MAPVCELEPPQAAKYAAPNPSADSLKNLNMPCLLLPQKRNNSSALRSVYLLYAGIPASSLDSTLLE
jgi:hypothetical protein